MIKNTPYHLAIIMDGNRRWARERGLPTLFGHKKGYENMKKVGKWCLDYGIKILTVYAFSTENWKRSKQEVSYLMRLLKLGLTKDLNFFHRYKIQLRVIGKRQGLPAFLISAIKKAEAATKNNKNGILNIALNYGGRLEIIEAIKKLIRKKLPANKIDDTIIEKHIWTADQPDPDLIIRTAGEQRLSGFLLWQSAYSELYFTNKYWPDFSEKDLDEAIKWYNGRERRFGK